LTAPSYDPADRPLEVGDVVILRSGGHAMTIESFVAAPAPPAAGPVYAGFSRGLNDRMARCIWHSADGIFQDRVCWPHTLARSAAASSAPSMPTSGAAAASSAPSMPTSGAADVRKPWPGQAPKEGAADRPVP
jgi:uncharacterized protein YodC (DUF2158 family)